MARPTRAVRRRHARETRQQQREEGWRNGHFSFQDQPLAVDPPATFGAAMAGYMGYGAPRMQYGGTTYYGYPTHSDMSAMGGFYGGAQYHMQALSAVDSGINGSTPNQRQEGGEGVDQQEAGNGEQAPEGQGDGEQDELNKDNEDEDDVGCMLHDFGEDCPFCGDLTEETKPEKYGGRPAVRTPTAAHHTTPIVKELTDIPRALVQNWLPGLGMPLPEKYLPKPQSPPVQFCNSCGVNVAKVESLETGPGHCPECRARWMVAYRTSQKQEAAKKARVTVLKPGNIVHRYAMAGCGLM